MPYRVNIADGSTALQRKLAILAADVAGYSRLMEADEERALDTLSAHRRIIDEVIGRHRGRIAGTAGDSVLAEFASVRDAAQAAIEIQNSLAEANDAAPEERRMEFRIGLNVGDVMVKDGDILAMASILLLVSRASPSRVASACRAAYETTFVTNWRSPSRIWVNSASKTSLARSVPSSFA
jgi:hypothetical protein